MAISNIDACFYKLLLQSGFKDEVYEWLNTIIDNCDNLEGITLDLACSLGDINKTISCLHNYINENDIDYSILNDMLREFINDKFVSNEISLRKAVKSLSGFTSITENYSLDKWYDFTLISDYYDLAESDIINYDKYYSIITNYLQEGGKLNPDKFWSKKNFKEIILEEKREMNPIRYKMNYIVVPIYLLLMVIILTVIGVTLSINEEKYTVLAIILFSVFGLFSLGLILSTPFIKKIEVKTELEKYDFTIHEEEKERYEITDKNGNKCILSKTGLLFNGKLYKYDDLVIDFYSTNYLRKVCLNIEFVFVNTDDEVAPYWNVRLNNDLVNAIVKYDIDFNGKDIFNYIINNKIDAFNQIITYGYVRKIKKDRLN